MKNVATIAKESDGTYADFRRRADAVVQQQLDGIAERLVDLVAAKLAEQYDLTIARREPEPPASEYPEPSPAADEASPSFHMEIDPDA
jgi:hypothetical protein